MPAEQIVSSQFNLDLSLVVAFAALILSALSPLVSSLISGFFRVKEKKMDIEADFNLKNIEFYEQHRAEVIELFIRSAGQAIKLHTNTNYAGFGASMGEIYMYVDESLWPLIDSISEKISRNSAESADQELVKLCKALSSAQIRKKHGVEPHESNGSKPK